ncbi:MAG: class I SAM-dependent methyltransferase [Clostridiales bacterium]|nr:class I SAM-dependent methyltransferase [Clostridiales bacterium]
MQYGELSFVYDALMYDMPYEKWAEFIFNNLGDANVIAELGCGTGNITEIISKKYDVTALDISEDMLEIARQKLLKSGISTRLIQGDMCNFSLHKEVDGIVCACDGINYLTTPAKVKQAFLNVYKNVKTGGRFIFDISSKNKLSSMNNQLYSEDCDDATYIWRNKIVNDLLEMEITFFVPKDDETYLRFDEHHIQRMHTVDEISKWLNESGFKIISITDDYTNNSVKEDTQRITFCAEKVER